MGSDSTARLVAATILLLLLAAALQLLVYGNGGHSALSDVPRVLLHRHIAPDAPPYLTRTLEYPVLSGVLLYSAVVAWPTPLGAFVLTMLAAGACCIYVTVRLTRRFGARAWRWALAAPLMLYAFQNWDAFAITALVVGLLAFEDHRTRTAGLALGIGGAIKLFPLVVVPVLAAVRWRQGRHDEARRLVGTTALTFGALNLPFAVSAAHRWWWTYQFQSQRQATWGSAWFYLLRMLHLPVTGQTGAQLANTLSLIGLVVGLVWLVWHVTRHDTDLYAVAAAAVAIFVLANKVYSPTYDVWLVAFFVMVPFTRRLWVAFCTVDVAVFITVYGSFHNLDSNQFVHTVLPVLVAIRTVVLLTVITHATRASHPRHHIRLSTRSAVPAGENTR